MVAGPSEYEDVLQCNNEPSSMTARGHQFPAAFLIRASGLDKVCSKYEPNFYFESSFHIPVRLSVVASTIFQPLGIAGTYFLAETFSHRQSSGCRTVLPLFKRNIMILAPQRTL